MSASQLLNAHPISSHPAPTCRADVHRSRSLLPTAAVALLLAGCAGQKAEPALDWLPDATGWTVRDVDPDESPTWVAYQRDARVADVKEIRVVGLVDAEPQVTMRALRHRLLADEYLPEGVTLTVLHEDEDEVLTYGLSPLPWPFRDREATEQMLFTEEDGVFRVDVNAIDTDADVPRGVVRVPVIRNSFVVTPTDAGNSVLTSSSVHDLGGAFPNRVIYGPVSDGLVDTLLTVRELTASFDDVASEEAGDVAHRE